MNSNYIIIIVMFSSIQCVFINIIYFLTRIPSTLYYILLNTIAYINRTNINSNILCIFMYL